MTPTGRFTKKEIELVRLIIGSMITNNSFTDVKPLWERIYNEHK